VLVEPTTHVGSHDEPDETLAQVLHGLGFTFISSPRVKGCNDIIIDGDVVFTGNADEAWVWVRSGGAGRCAAQTRAQRDATKWRESETKAIDETSSARFDDNTHAKLSAMAKSVLGETPPEAERVRCAESGCSRWYAGEMLPGWFIYTSHAKRATVAYCHSHAARGRQEFNAQAAHLPRPVDNALATNGVNALDSTRAPDEAARKDNAFERARENVKIADEARKAKRGPKSGARAPKVIRIIGCSYTGCLETFPVTDEFGTPPVGVEHPPKGWWVHEEDEKGRHGRSQGAGTGLSSPSTVRDYYCTDPVHHALAESRTARALEKAIAEEQAEGFEPELDDAPPWDDEPAPAVEIRKREPGVEEYVNTDGSHRRELRLPEEVFAQDSLVPGADPLVEEAPPWE
ncbi:MAG: hypothetical protein JWM74_5010, partial [Myxococcaceae bacterium]|nr:hypothetical protein [Myxococcaceae bacterium]